MKKFLILQMRPEDETADAEFESILQKGKLNNLLAQRLRVEKNYNTQIDLDQYCAIIAGGSPFDISLPIQKKTPTQLGVEDFFERLFSNVVPRDFPFLGACSGNGLLGKYCGTEISSKYAEAIGPVEINITEEGSRDELLRGFPASFIALAGHKEACDTLPKDAILLASSKPCPIQMFRVKNNIYATQFHPEADEDQFCLRVDIYKNFGYFAPEESENIKKVLKGVETPYSNEILKRFVKKYQKNS